MAELNLCFYSGKDIYTDGKIEESILENVKSGKCLEEFDYANDQDKFAVFYHMSPIRENILNWYPFKENSSILEVGAGCGAITGLLCRRGAKVTAVELSYKRSCINYERNRGYSNLEIVVGNLNEIDFSQKYDYIILNGVLEYALSFTASEDPYCDFLKKISSLLNLEGRILIAIENRMGLKYFNGAKEDHTNNFFLGLNNYRGNESVRTFGKAELTELLCKSGLEYMNFYYPFPDYKFPMEIYTDETINKKKFRAEWNFQPERYSFFYEDGVRNTLAQEGVLQLFSNSFLVEASKVPVIQKVLYAKLNTSRKKRFQIATVIFEDEKQRYVQKIALNEDSQRHIQKINENENYIVGDNVINLKGKLVGDYVEYPFLNEESLDSYIEKLIEKRKVEEIKDIILLMKNTLLKRAELRSDFDSQNFKMYFGKIEAEKSYYCINNANIDLICDNIFVVNSQWIVIDCEWICDFWVPIEFIIWRMVNELFAKHYKMCQLIDQNEFYQMLGIDQFDQGLFREWGLNFAEKFVNDRTTEQYKKNIQFLPIDQLLALQNRDRTIVTNLYIDSGNGFNENEKRYEEILLRNGEFRVTFDLRDYETICGLRWDPLEYRICRCKNIQVKSNIGDIKAVAYNAISKEGDLFLNIDPNYLLEWENERKIETITISGIINFVNEIELSEIIENKSDLNYQTIKSLKDDIVQSEIEKENLRNALNDEIERKDQLERNLSDEIEKNKYCDQELFIAREATRAYSAASLKNEQKVRKCMEENLELTEINRKMKCQIEQMAEELEKIKNENIILEHKLTEKNDFCGNIIAFIKKVSGGKVRE